MNLLITGACPISDYQSETIKSWGYNVIEMAMENGKLPISPAEIDAVVCNGLFLYHDIKHFDNLKFIQLTSAGLDRVPLDYILKNDIKLHNARGVYSIPMAEWVVMRILEIYKISTIFNSQQKNKQWLKHRNLQEVAGKKVAIIGAGNIGSEIAKRLAAFDANVVGFDVCVKPSLYFNDIKLILGFSDVVNDYDIVILTAPLTSETKNMINESILLRMKENALLINVSRGGLIDEIALSKVLACRTDIHAVLDVFASEPLSIESPLWDMENVKISPHNSFVGNGNQMRLSELVMKNLKDFAHVI